MSTSGSLWSRSRSMDRACCARACWIKCGTETPPPPLTQSCNYQETVADVIERLVSFLDRWTHQAFFPPSPPTPPTPPTDPAPRVDAFPEAVERLLKLEGGYVDDPADSGGETNFGITKRSYPDLD